MSYTKICKKKSLRFHSVRQDVIRVFDLAIHGFRILGAFVVIGAAAGATTTDCRHYKSGKAKHSQKLTNHIIPL